MRSVCYSSHRKLSPGKESGKTLPGSAGLLWGRPCIPVPQSSFKRPLNKSPKVICTLLGELFKSNLVCGGRLEVRGGSDGKMRRRAWWEVQVRSRRPGDHVRDPAWGREPRRGAHGEVTGMDDHCSSDWAFDRNITPPLPSADLSPLPRLTLHRKDAQTPRRSRTWPPGAPGQWESLGWSLSHPQILPSQFQLGGTAVTSFSRAEMTSLGVQLHI